MPAGRELLGDEPPPRTSLDGVLGQDRRLAVMRCSLSELRSIGHANHATANDVLLAITAGGLRALLMGRGEPVGGVWVPIYVPITMRRRWRGPVAGNRVAQMAVPLPLGVADPLERLAKIAAATATRKARDRSAVGKLFRSPLATMLLLMAVNRQRVNVCSANIPGPKAPLSLAGSRALEVVPILPLIGRVSLGVGAVSYAGAFTIGVTADRQAFPDLDTFVTGMQRELEAIRTSRTPGISPAPSVRSRAYSSGAKMQSRLGAGRIGVHGVLERLVPGTHEPEVEPVDVERRDVHAIGEDQGVSGLEGAAFVDGRT